MGKYGLGGDEGFPPWERKTAPPPKNGYPLFYWQKPMKEGVAVFRGGRFSFPWIQWENVDGGG